MPCNSTNLIQPFMGEQDRRDCGTTAKVRPVGGEGPYTSITSIASEVAHGGRRSAIIVNDQLHYCMGAREVQASTAQKVNMEGRCEIGIHSQKIESMQRHSWRARGGTLP